MNVVAFPKRGAARTIAQGRDAEVLHRIGDPGIAATIWQRRPQPEFVDWLAGLPPARLPRLRTLATIEAVEAGVQAACDLAATPRGRFRDMLAGDIAALAYITAEITGATLLHLRLEAIGNNACRKFHVDQMRARMLCTYRGSGTQLALPGQEDRPLNVATGSALLLRGALWPDEGTELLHRSPPIEGTGETRLLAVIDPAADHQTDTRDIH